MKKYRVKITGERIVGPFSIEQIGELFIKGKITGEEECQLFPAGEWKKIDAFKEISRLFLDIIGRKVTLEDLKEKNESRTVVNMTVEGLKKKQVETKKNTDGMQEFQFSKEKAPAPPPPKIEEEKIEAKEEKKAEDAVDATRVEKKVVDEDEFDKTVVRPEVLAEIEAEKEAKRKKEEEKRLAEEAAKLEEEKLEEEKIDVDEKTEFLDFKKIKATEQLDDKEQLEAEMQEVEQEMLEAQRLEEDIPAEKSTKGKKDDEDDDVDEKAAKDKKRKRIIYGIVLLAMAFFMLPEEKKEGGKPIRPKIVFPVAKEFVDAKKSIQFYTNGVKAYKKNTFAAKVKASKYFKNSLEFKFKDNDSLGYLILTYSEVVLNSKNQVKSSKVIFDLIQLAKTKILNDVNVALGAAIFYRNLEKYAAAKKILENFLRVKSKVTPKFFAVYLDVLTKIGDFEGAKSLFDKLCKGVSLPVEGVLGCSNYLIINEEKDKALDMVSVGLERHSKSAPLLLMKGELSFQTGKYKELTPLLKKVKSVSAERSPIYYSKYLELVGVNLAVLGKKEQAIKFMQKALEYYDSPELRSKLASIELDDGKSGSLVKESRSYDLVNQAKKKIAKRKYHEAMRLAIEACDMAPTNVEAKMLLARIQVKMGYVGDAIRELVELQADHSSDTKINYLLINAYLEASRLEEAIKQILTVKNSKFSKTAEYASLLARYYTKRRNYPLALSWYQKSIKRNPLNADDYFMFAKLLLRIKKYRESKLKITKAIELESNNVEYYSLYGKILYEVDGVDTAIGYLRKKLLDFPEDSKLLGDVAKYYYRSGKLDEFEEYKRKVEQRVDVDEDYYRFMIEAAKLEDRTEDVIEYSQRLIAMSPGDIESRMFLGEFFLSKRETDKALKIFEEIDNQLTTYPKVHYYLAKCYLQKKDYQKAYDEGQIEIKNNANLEYGHFVTGEALKEMKKYPEAVKSMEKAISINGKLVEALLSLGWMKHKQNYLKEARELYMRALREEPGNPEANRELGLVYRSIGQSSLAIESLKLYLDLVPQAHDKTQIEQIIKKLQ